MYQIENSGLDGKKHKMNKDNPYSKILEHAKLATKVELPTMSQADSMRNTPSMVSSNAINENIKNAMANQAAIQKPQKQSPLSEESIAGINKLAEDAEKIKELEAEELNDDYFYDNYGTKIRNIHLNKKRRKAIEERCSEMSISDLLSNPDQTLEQIVPIVPGKFEVVYKSISGKEDLLIKAILSRENQNKNHLSASYVLGKMGLLNVTCSIVRINDRRFQDIKDSNGKPSEELLLSKFETISNYPVDILADLSANYFWFTERVKQLTSVDNILNF